MQQEVPRLHQLTLNPEKSLLAPKNALKLVTNVILRLEHSHLYGPVGHRERVLARLAGLEQRREAIDLARVEVDNIGDLTIGAFVAPERYGRPLQEAKQKLHTRKAAEYQTALDATDLPLNGLRRWNTARRQARHQRLAVKAGKQLADAAIMEAR